MVTGQWSVVRVVEQPDMAIFMKWEDVRRKIFKKYFQSIQGLILSPWGGSEDVFCVLTDLGRG